MSNYNNPNYSNTYQAQPASQKLQPANPQVYKRSLLMREIDRIIPGNKKESFGSLEFKPKNIRFATQNKGERVYILVRRHWITNIGWVFKNVFYSIIPFIVFAIISAFSIDVSFLAQKAKILLIIFYESLIFTNIVKEFLDWYFDPYIVTNERILDYDFRPFSSYTIKETSLGNIENIKEKSGGVFANIFNYGDVSILTASETKGELNFISIPNPTEVRNVMQDLTNIYKKLNDGN